jgi:phenylacetate-CoA ligase
MIFSGEPGASIPGVRDKIEQLYGARCSIPAPWPRMTPWMNVAGTAETPGLLCWQDVVYTEVCDPETHGAACPTASAAPRSTPIWSAPRSR